MDLISDGCPGIRNDVKLDDEEFSMAALPLPNKHLQTLELTLDHMPKEPKPRTKPEPTGLQRITHSLGQVPPDAPNLSQVNRNACLTCQALQGKTASNEDNESEEDIAPMEQLKRNGAKKAQRKKSKTASNVGQAEQEEGEEEQAPAPTKKSSKMKKSTVANLRDHVTHGPEHEQLEDVPVVVPLVRDALALFSEAEPDSTSWPPTPNEPSRSSHYYSSISSTIAMMQLYEPVLFICARSH
ncbi:hypothetical protein BDP27DRAFT_1406860 [Rhodocollybia butyracea]|uniref:Uncharacterized protein n=1 Tax=Rhodocollybia butyracea TaxID=206335 RepID=A0A9P5PC12_9AGAR|nr:hypothetical protein BDP27DRAFT_1406860 [Rhodocollybia butyracea]